MSLGHRHEASTTSLGFNNPHSNDIFPNFQYKPPMVQFCAVPIHPVIRYHGEEICTSLSTCAQYYEYEALTKKQFNAMMLKCDQCEITMFKLLDVAFVCVCPLLSRSPPLEELCQREIANSRCLLSQPNYQNQKHPTSLLNNHLPFLWWEILVPDFL